MGYEFPAMARDEGPVAPVGAPHGVPHSPDAERTVLGTLFLRPEHLGDVQTALDTEDFFDPRHQEIYQVIVDLAVQNQAIDLMVVLNELERRGVLEKVGGPSYLAAFEQYVVVPANVLYHAQIVREKSRLRQLQRAGLEIAEAARMERDKSDELLRDSEAKLFGILDQQSGMGEFRSIRDGATEIHSELVSRHENRRGTTGITSGLADLDRLLGGFQRSDLIILAARPSVGKTSLALNIAAAAAKSLMHGSDGKPYRPGVGIFSLEMSYDQVVHRLVCTEAQIPMSLVRKNMLNEPQFEQYQTYLQQLSDLDIYISDTPGLSPIEVQLQAQRLKRRCPNLGMIVIDYLQLMSIKGGRNESRQQEVSEISRSMKALARDLDVPVLALSQLSRGIESRTKKDARPRLSDLRESGAIEQDADVVMFIHREDDGREIEPRNPNEPSVRQVSLVVAKQRNGPIGDVNVLFREDFTQFVNLAANASDRGAY